MAKFELEARYRLAPQLRDYDRLDFVWHPYLMTFHAGNHRSSTVNTDAHGFRLGVRDGVRYGNFDDPDREARLLVGGSVAFGVGASSDATTIPSLLAQGGDDVWLNFGGKAASATQELLLFQLHRERLTGLRQVVLFSGVNELLLHVMGMGALSEYPPFFFLPRFAARMHAEKRSRGGRLLDALLGRPVDKPVGFEPKASPDAPERAVARYRSCLRAWRELVPGEVPILFVLQPLVNWSERKLAPQEVELFEELDRDPSNTWRTLGQEFSADLGSWYAEELRKSCESFGIGFRDSGAAFGSHRLDGRWLFVDRGHMTDDGNRVAASFLREVMDA